MPTYTAPLRDFNFLMNEVFNFDEHYQKLPNGSDAAENKQAMLEELAKFAQEVLTPLNQVGDQESCQLQDGQVTTPTGFKKAYQQYVEGGWPALSQHPDYGGMGLPTSIGMPLNEIICSANLAWGMYPGLTDGAMRAIQQHASDELKQAYLPKLISGEWTGTMCLTEPHCGTDLGLIKSTAKPQADGSYQITGTKIFISAGEHDLTENIVHLVLAKLPDAPEGSKGISLFLVPKRLPDAEGAAGEANGVSCGSLENKMGIHGNSTCVMNFDNATGFMLGQPNKGLAAMFTMMNTARLGVGIQGLGLIEASFQNALDYARERLQMRSLTGAKMPDKPADAIIVHPDVRRMLLTQKAFAEGGRAMVLYTAQLIDLAEQGSNEEEKQEADALLGLLTPVIKAFLTEVGFEATNEGVQIFGGHGFIQENGMEQFVRDARITRLYEGTTGIQALDLLGRKILLNQGEDLRKLTKLVHKYCQKISQNEAMHEYALTLTKLNKEWGELTMQVGMQAMQGREAVGSAAVDYLMYSGYILLAYFWAQMVEVSLEKLASNPSNANFYQAKLATANFYYQKILPRTQFHAATMQAGPATLMELSSEDFGLGFEI